MEGSGSGSGSGLRENELRYCRRTQLSSTSISLNTTWLARDGVSAYTPYVAAILLLFFLVSFIWNLFIIVTFLTKIKKLKDPSHLYIFNLALTDILLSIFIIFPAFLSNTLQSFIIGKSDRERCGICEFLGFMYVFLFASILHTLAIISFDRFMQLLKPLTYQRYFNFKKALLIITISWLISLALGLPPFFGLGEYSFNTLQLTCQSRWTGESSNGVKNVFYIVLLSCEGLLPLFFLIITNAWTYKHIKRFFKKNRVREVTLSSSVATQQQKVYDHRQAQLLKVFGALLIGHLICWIPVAAVIITGLIVDPDDFPESVFILSNLSYFLNPVLHPILETIFNHT